MISQEENFSHYHSTETKYDFFFGFEEEFLLHEIRYERYGIVFLFCVIKIRIFK